MRISIFPHDRLILSGDLDHSGVRGTLVSTEGAITEDQDASISKLTCVVLLRDDGRVKVPDDFTSRSGDDEDSWCASQ
jgi:hypothetical protein